MADHSADTLLQHFIIFTIYVIDFYYKFMIAYQWYLCYARDKLSLVLNYQSQAFSCSVAIVVDASDDSSLTSFTTM